MLLKAGAYPMSIEIAGASPRYDSALGDRRVTWHDRRRVITDRHVRISRQSGDALEVQERHSPTIEIAVDDSEGRRRARRNLTRVRQSEAWRHNQLSTLQRQAEGEMRDAFEARIAGLKIAAMNFERVSLGVDDRGPTGRAIDADARWRAWFSVARKKKIATSVVIDCLAALVTLADIEKAYRKGNGWALGHYQRGLDLWAVMRGWLPASYVLGS